MDVTAMLFYAVICGALSGASPKLGGRMMRIGFGGVVGIVAAATLPYVKSTIGL